MHNLQLIPPCWMHELRIKPDIDPICLIMSMKKMHRSERFSMGWALWALESHVQVCAACMHATVRSPVWRQEAMQQCSHELVRAAVRLRARKHAVKIKLSLLQEVQS